MNNELNLCTNLLYDFNDSKWTDYEFTDENQFILRWQARFGSLWENFEHSSPMQPYSPIIASIGYKLAYNHFLHSTKQGVLQHFGDLYMVVFRSPSGKGSNNHQLMCRYSIEEIIY